MSMAYSFHKFLASLVMAEDIRSFRPETPQIGSYRAPAQAKQLCGAGLGFKMAQHGLAFATTETIVLWKVFA